MSQLVLSESSTAPAVYLIAVDRDAAEIELRGERHRLPWSLLRAAATQQDADLAFRYDAVLRAAEAHLLFSAEQVQWLAADVMRAVSLPRFKKVGARGCAWYQRNFERDDALRACSGRLHELREEILGEVAQRQRELDDQFPLADMRAAGVSSGRIKWAAGGRSLAGCYDARYRTVELRERLVQLSELGRELERAWAER